MVHYTHTSPSSFSISSVAHQDSLFYWGAWRYSEVVDWHKWPCCHPLTEEFDEQCGRTIWGSRDSLRTGDWLLGSYGLQVKLDIVVRHMPVSIILFALYASMVGLKSEFSHVPWIKYQGEGRAFAFVLAPWWGRHKKILRRASLA